MSVENTVNAPLTQELGTPGTGTEAGDIQAIIERQFKQYELSQRLKNEAGAPKTQAEIEAILAQNGGGSATPAPIKFKVRGEDFTFNTPEELAGAIEHLQELAAKGMQAQPVAPAQTAPPAQEYSEAEFEKLLKSEDGTRRAMDYLHRNSPVYKELRGALETLAAQNQQLVMRATAEDIKTNYGWQPKNANEFAAVNRIREEFGGNAQNRVAWEAAIATAVNRGLIERPGVASSEPASQAGTGQYGQQQPRSGGFNPAAPRVMTPPPMGSNQSQGAGPTMDLWDMPLEVVEKAWNEKNALKARQGGGY